MGVDNGRRWLTTAGRSDLLEKQMEKKFKQLADTVKQNEKAIKPLSHPVGKEIIRTWPLVDEWDMYTKPLLTMDEIRKLLNMEPSKRVLYADGVPYEWEDGEKRWKCHYCGGIRTGERCSGCGAPKSVGLE